MKSQSITSKAAASAKSSLRSPASTPRKAVDASQAPPVSTTQPTGKIAILTALLRRPRRGMPCRHDGGDWMARTFRPRGDGGFDQEEAEAADQLNQDRRRPLLARSRG